MTTTLVSAAPLRPLRLPALTAFLGVVAFALAPATAQTRKELGRMWTFEAAPLGWFQQAYDWQPTQAWLDHARLSSLRLGKKDKSNPDGYTFFCSASFVSPHGLVMTNHHCSREGIASVQGDNDWQRDGFYAGAYEAEVKLPGIVASQLVAQRDVTKEVAASSIDAVLQAAKEQQPELLHQVIPLYQGGNYQLYSSKMYDDLRLVCVPHGQSAHFGGDFDNFCYPRWGLDYSFLRAYEGGEPAQTDTQCFQWKTAGANEGDLVFVTGNPGRTGRLQTYAQCEYLRDYRLPAIVEDTHKQLAALNAEAKTSAAAEKKLRAEILKQENSRKALQGYLDGLRTPRIMAIKQKAESELRAAVAKNEELQKNYGDAWDNVAALQKAKVAALGDKTKAAELAKAEQVENKRIGEACFAVYGTSIPPDATMSLRISDGVVKGFEMNGTIAPYFTSLYGLFARHHEFGGVHPFDLPQAWLDKEKELDLQTPFNFVATCDIIGGNSGSPMIDKEQHVVGLIFDGNIEMLGNNFVFDDQVSRTVSVHPAIIIESLRKVYGAGKLADELERVGGAGKKTGAMPAKKGALDAAAAEARITKAKTDLQLLQDAVRMYRARNGKMPESLETLATKDERGRSTMESLPKDPWGHDYILREGDTPRMFEVVCMGADGAENTEDDISSRAKPRRE
ncbi:MAG: S46 family peptidase [Planctomycetota bacterium]